MDYLVFLKNTLPTKPYCTDDLRAGLKIRPAATAIKYRYIQLNHLVVNYLIFDVDKPGAACAWETGNVATPNIAVINQENQHAHLIYFLATGISKFPTSSLKALKYLAAVEQAYTTRLKADAGYVGLLAKNPLNPFWLTWNICNRQYDLAELADYVELKTAKEKEQIQTGVGRNVYLFDSGRFYAYGAVREYRQDKIYQEFLNVVYSHLQGLNAIFPAPLPINEVFSTAKSIAKWTWRHDRQAERAFIERQRYKGKLSGHVRAILASQKKDKAIELKAAGYSISAIARELEVDRSQIYKRYFR